MDIYVRSSQLLESLANSLHDREDSKYGDFTFTTKELLIVERWLKDVIAEGIKKMAEY